VLLKGGHLRTLPNEHRLQQARSGKLQYHYMRFYWAVANCIANCVVLRYGLFCADRRMVIDILVGGKQVLELPRPYIE
jgi:hypothetical protein